VADELGKGGHYAGCYGSGGPGILAVSIVKDEWEGGVECTPSVGECMEDNG
jgi:hypothetical protein